MTMKRRDFATLLGAAAAWPLVARAQQAPVPVIGYLSSRTPQSDVPMLAAIKQGLGAAGYVENRNVAIEYRFANGQYDRHSVLAAELVRRQVAVILSAGDQSASLAAKAATSSIPIVFNTGLDPVQGGLVARINRPGGNVTGVFSQATSLVGKSMGLLRELVPGAKTIAILDNPTNSGAAQRMKEADEAAAALGLQVRLLAASTESGIDTAFATFVSEPADIMQVMVDGFFLTRTRASKSTGSFPFDLAVTFTVRPATKWSTRSPMPAISNVSSPVNLSESAFCPAANCSGRMPMPTRFERWMRS